MGVIGIALVIAGATLVANGGPGAVVYAGWTIFALGVAIALAALLCGPIRRRSSRQMRG